MKKLLLVSILLFSVFVVTGCTNKETQIITEDQLVGDWEVVIGDFESIIIDEDGSFYTHLHERPFLDGTWRLEDNKLYLDASLDDASSYDFDLISYRQNNLFLRDEQGTDRWKR